MNRQTSLPGREASWNKRTDTPLTPIKRPSLKPYPGKKMETATPKLQPVRQPPQTEQIRTGYSVQVENWTQKTQRPHVQQVQGWRVWDVPMQCRHHECRTPTAALSTTWCYEAGHVAWTNATEGQALWQPGGAEEDSRFHEDNRHLHLAYDDDEEEEAGTLTKQQITTPQTLVPQTLPLLQQTDSLAVPQTRTARLVPLILTVPVVQQT